MDDNTGRYQGLEHLEVWLKAKDLAVLICAKILPVIPEVEKYALISQLRRSSQSIAANIAEGYGRFYFQEGVRFAYIARGSLLETQNHLVYAREMNYIDEKLFVELSHRLEDILKMIHGYINYLKKSKRGVNEPGSQYIVNEMMAK